MQPGSVRHAGAPIRIAAALAATTPVHPDPPDPPDPFRAAHRHIPPRAAPCFGRRAGLTGTAMDLAKTFDITKNFVKAKRPCADGFRWFIRHHHEGSNYQELLDALVAAGRVNDACWLLDQFGPTDGVLEVDSLGADAIVFAGTLEVRGNIEADTLIRAGRSIVAGGSIRAGTALVAGEDVKAGGGLRCDGAARVGGDLRVEWGVDCAADLAVGGDLRAAWDVQVGGDLRVDGSAHVGQGLVVAGPVYCGKSLRAGGSIAGADTVRAGSGIVAGGDIRAARHLEAGWGIRAGGDMAAEGAIRAGESLHAQGEIRAGSGFGIFAGLDVAVEAWDASARVCAATRPEALMSGCWAGACPV